MHLPLRLGPPVRLTLVSLLPGRVRSGPLLPHRDQVGWHAAAAAATAAAGSDRAGPGRVGLALLVQPLLFDVFDPPLLLLPSLLLLVDFGGRLAPLRRLPLLRHGRRRPSPSRVTRARDQREMHEWRAGGMGGGNGRASPVAGRAAAPAVPPLDSHSTACSTPPAVASSALRACAES